MNKRYIIIYLYNFIILIISLHFKLYYNKGTYNYGIYNNIYLDKYARLLSQDITEETLHHSLSTLNVENCKGENNKYRVICTLGDERVDNIMMNEKNMIYYNIINDKLYKEYDKYHKKNISLKRNKMNTTIKDILYKMIFKGKTFWNVLKNVITGMGSAALISSILLRILFISGVQNITISFALIPGGMVLLIIILCVLSWLLVTWLWPYKYEYNSNHKK